MNLATIEIPPPDPKSAGDDAARKVAQSARRRGLSWSPYLRRTCFHTAPDPKVEEQGEDAPATEAPEPGSGEGPES